MYIILIINIINNKCNNEWNRFWKQQNRGWYVISLFWVGHYFTLILWMRATHTDTYIYTDITKYPIGCKSSSWFPSLLWKQSPHLTVIIQCGVLTKHYDYERRDSLSEGSLQVQSVAKLMSDLIGRCVLIKTSVIHLRALFSTRLVGGADRCERWERGQNHFVAGETKWSEVKSS